MVIESTRRNLLSRLGALAALVSGVPKLVPGLLAAQTAAPAAPAPGMPAHRTANHTHNGIYYFSGTGSNDGYPKEDHILVTDPFDKHVTRTMDALKKSVESAGCTMDSIINAQVFLCLPLADGVTTPTGRRASMRTRRSTMP